MRMTQLRSDLPPALVIGLDCMTGLQTARILAGHSVPVFGLVGDRGHPCSRTSVCKDVLVMPEEGERQVAQLLDLRERFDLDPVLMPCTDRAVSLVSGNREKLSGFRFVLPQHEMLETLSNKVQLSRWCSENGFRVPQTHWIKDRADLLEASELVGFPCIVKPAVKSLLWERNTRFKALKIKSADELNRVYDKCSEWTEELMVQEWIEGEDSDLFSCNCYFDQDGRPVVTFVARKLRQWPPRIGTSSLGEECRNDEVLNTSLDFFERAGICGMAYLEMKRDRAAGDYCIIEPNIGRPTGRSAIAEAGGVDYVYTAYCDAAGRELSRNLEQQYRGVKWVYLRRDVQSACHDWSRGALTVRAWLQSWKGVKGYALFSWRDPVPFLADIWKSLAKVLNRRRRKTRRARSSLSPTAA